MGHGVGPVHGQDTRRHVRQYGRVAVHDGAALRPQAMQNGQQQVVDSVSRSVPGSEDSVCSGNGYALSFAPGTQTASHPPQLIHQTAAETPSTASVDEFDHNRVGEGRADRNSLDSRLGQLGLEVSQQPTPGFEGPWVTHQRRAFHNGRHLLLEPAAARTSRSRRRQIPTGRQAWPAGRPPT